jgi:hypothetical protein
MPSVRKGTALPIHYPDRTVMRVKIQGILYETAVIHEAHDVHTTVLIPVNSDKTLAELAQEGRLYLLPQDMKTKKEGEKA